VEALVVQMQVVIIYGPHDTAALRKAGIDAWRHVGSRSNSTIMQ
jgi:hypothetical protein